MPAKKKPRAPRGADSVFQAGDGRWRAFGFVGERRVSVSASSRTEARNLLALRKAEVLSGVDRGGGRKLSVDAYAARWLLDVRTRYQAGQLKPSTVEAYTSAVERYIVPYLGRSTIEGLRPMDVTGWHAELLRDGRSPGTVSVAHKVLVAILRSAQRERLVLDNVASLAGGPSGVEPRTDHLAPGEVAQVVASLDGSRSSAAVALGLLGLRRGELLGVRWDDVELDAGLLTVRSAIVAVQGRGVVGTPKRRASFRTIRLAPVLGECLRAWKVQQAAQRLAAGPLWSDQGYVLTTRHGRPVDPNSLRRAVARFVEDACGRSVSPHVLRHTSASLMFAAGVPVTNIADHLGHSGPSVTSKVYVHLFDEGRREAGDALERALRDAR